MARETWTFVGAYVLGLALLPGCSGGGGGGGGGSCTSTPSCVTFDVCPELTCRCPGDRFNTTTQICLDGCCARNCDEACGINACTNQTCSGHGTCSLVGKDAAKCTCDAGYLPAGEGLQCFPEGAECMVSSECDDGDPCTFDSCSGGRCTASGSSGEPCDDGNACTSGDLCAYGLCIGTFIDGDGDGQSPAGCGGPDCDDTNAAILANGAERTAARNCNDGVDNDCDGLVDAKDEGCTMTLADGCRADGWCWENPLPQGEDLVAVWASGPDDAWFVGGRAIVHYNGTSFELLDPGIDAWFSSVSGTGPNDIWIAGIGGLLHWDGSGFTDRTTELPISLDEAPSVWAVSPTRVWLSIDYYMLNWDGSAWMSETAPDIDGPLIGAPDGTMFIAIPDLNDAALWKWTDSFAARTLAAESLRASPVAAVSSTDVWLIRQYYSGPNVVHWDGSEVAEFYVPGELGAGTRTPSGAVWLANPNAVAGSDFVHVSKGAFTPWQGPNTNAGALWATSDNDVWAVGPFGTIAHFDGKRWTERSIRMAKPCSTIWGIDDANVFCVGRGGGAARRTPAGWEPLATGTTEDLLGIWGSSAADLWITGANKTLLRGPPKGLSPSTAPGLGFGRITGTSATDVWAIGQDALWHFDGSDWLSVATKGLPDFTAVHATAPGKAFLLETNFLEQRAWIHRCLATGCTEVEFASNVRFEAVWGVDEDVWAVGGNNIVRSPSWKNESSILSETRVNLSAVSGSGPADVWAAGWGALFHWDGVGWASVPGMPYYSWQGPVAWTGAGASVFIVSEVILRKPRP